MHLTPVRDLLRKKGVKNILVIFAKEIYFYKYYMWSLFIIDHQSV